AAVAAPTQAWAQAAAQPAIGAVSPGWYARPSFRISEEFNDNIFATSSGRDSDFVSRFSPDLELGYRSQPFTVLLSGGFDAEVYAENPQLNDAVAVKRAGLTLQYIPDRPLTLDLTVAYTESRNFSTLSPFLTGPIINPVGITTVANATEFGFN